MRPRILCVSTFLPFPLDQGDPIRVLGVISALSAIGDVTAVSVRRPTTTDADVHALGEQLSDARLKVFDRDRPEPRSLRAYVESGSRGIRHASPMWIADRYSSAMAAYVAAHSRDVDAVVLIGEAAGAYAPAVPSPLTIWDKANVLAVSTRHQALHPQSLKSFARAVFNAPLARAFERRTLDRTGVVWVTSDTESEKLDAEYGRAADAVIPSALSDALPAELETYTPSTRGRTLLWMSSFGYSSNWDGLARFLRETRDQFTLEHATIRVVGSGMTQTQRDLLADYPHVDVRGFVPDLRDAVHGCDCAVIPLWTGAGVKLKTLTLMAMGIPVVATPVAMEGIPLDAAAAVSATATGLASEALTLTSERLEQARERAYELLQERFTPDAFRRQIIDSMTVALRPQPATEEHQ